MLAASEKSTGPLEPLRAGPVQGIEREKRAPNCFWGRSLFLARAKQVQRLKRGEQRWPTTFQ